MIAFITERAGKISVDLCQIKNTENGKNLVSSPVY